MAFQGPHRERNWSWLWGRKRLEQLDSEGGSEEGEEKDRWEGTSQERLWAVGGVEGWTVHLRPVHRPGVSILGTKSATTSGRDPLHSKEAR